jgi:hypothetical protein
MENKITKVILFGGLGADYKSIGPQGPKSEEAKE